MLEQGEVWTAPFPYYNREGELQDKRRPTLIVSDDRINTKNLDVIICQISRHDQRRILKLPKELRDKIVIITPSDFLSGRGLRNISIVKPFNLFTIPKRILIKGEFVGKLCDEKFQNLLDIIHHLF